MVNQTKSGLCISNGDTDLFLMKKRGEHRTVDLAHHRKWPQQWFKDQEYKAIFQARFGSQLYFL
jgi:hypothetical protein